MQKNRRTSLFYALRLRCIYCGQTALLEKGSFVQFQRGCDSCGYLFEREVGYFSGASWMINYTLAGLTAMLCGAYMVWKHSDKGDLIVAGVPALIGLLISVGFIPFGRALWMYIDHRLHPLTDSDFRRGERTSDAT
jgi:hypothetical protein